MRFIQKLKMAAKSGGKKIARKSPVYFADTLWVKNFIKIALSRTVSKINVFFAKIQDGRQKWQENNFREKSPVDSAHTMWVKIFIEIALSADRSKYVYAFLAKMQKFRVAVIFKWRKIF